MARVLVSVNRVFRYQQKPSCHYRIYRSVGDRRSQVHAYVISRQATGTEDVAPWLCLSKVCLVRRPRPLPTRPGRVRLVRVVYVFRGWPLQTPCQPAAEGWSSSPFQSSSTFGHRDYYGYVACEPPVAFTLLVYVVSSRPAVHPKVRGLVVRETS